MDMENLITEILQKKELKGISREVVNSYLVSYLKKRSIRLDNISGKNSKPIIKDARAHLRTLVGRFHIKETKLSGFLQNHDWDSVLKTHTSTKERASSYDEIRDYVYSLQPKKILDLGCGLNPIALAKKSVFYYASDINGQDLEIIKEFFKDKDIAGEVFVKDLTVSQAGLPKVDLVLMFKLVDFLEKVSAKITQKLLMNLDAKHILISFATRKLSGKVMEKPQRLWFENLCFHQGYNYKKFIIGDEIFYHITK